jgi:hypothetical protein
VVVVACSAVAERGNIVACSAVIMRSNVAWCATTIRSVASARFRVVAMHRVVVT